MIPHNHTHAKIVRVLATYAVSCFVILQLIDIVQQPLGVSIEAFRWIMLLMAALAPILVIVVAWHSRRSTTGSPDASVQADQQAVFRIGHAELDTAQRQIRFADTTADVQPKVFDLIEYLVRARERVVSKNELFDNIWPDVVVTEASLTQSIKRARDIFRQNGFDKEIIRTVSRKGYQFDCPIDAVSTGRQSQPNTWTDVVLPTTVVSVAAFAIGLLVWNSGSVSEYKPVSSDAANSLVVLPFANMTADEGFRYFSDGLTETLTSSLTTIRHLRVIARGSAFSFGDEQFDYPAIGQALNVAHIVAGSVQRDDNAIRISTRLVRSQDGQQIWSQIYSGNFDDVFALQDEISRSIVNQMSLILSTQLALPASEPDQQSNPEYAEAFRLLLLGQEQVRNGSTRNLQEAERNFRAALHLRPDYPEAVLALANVLRVRATLGELPREPAFAEALALTRQSLELRPEYGNAYIQLGEIQHRHFWDFTSAARSYAMALELAPGSAGAHAAFSRFLSKTGDFEGAVNEAEAAVDLDPRSAQSLSSLAIRQIRARRLDKARIVIDQLTEIFPDNAGLPWLEANWHIRNESYRDALQWIALEELDYLRLSISAIVLYHLERREQSREVLDELIRTDADGAAFQIAEVYAQWGQVEQAFEWLERAFSQGDPGLAELYSSVHLGNLYADPRFADLVARVGLPERAPL